MNRLIRGPVVLAVALVALSCKGDPTSSLRNGVDQLIADPGALFLRPDSTKPLIVGAVDEQGNQIQAHYTLGTVTPGLTVVVDPAFNLVYNDTGVLVKPDQATREQFLVTATAGSGDLSFVVNGGGKSVTIPVRLLPDSAASVTLSNAAPALGDTVVATAATNFKFTPASVVSISGAGVKTVGINADSTQIRFLPGPSSNNLVLISNTIVAYAPAIPAYTAKSDVPLVTSAVPPITPLISNAAPNVNGLVTLTAPAGIKFLPSVKVIFGTDQQAVTSVGADSNSLVFRAHKAGASGTITIGNAALDFLTSVPFPVATTNTVTVGATVISLTGTDALATAPLIVIPDAGNTGGIIDAGAFAVGPAACSGTLGGPCRLYKFVLSTARSFSVSATWQGTTDIGVYFANSAGTVNLTILGCDAKGAGAAGQPETCTVTALAAGTYYLIVDSFAPFYAPPNDVDPTDINVAITGS